MDYASFVKEDKALLIAPAGYGKTFTIVESLKYTSGKQLILTHTHAGVASIKSKLKEASIGSDKYSVETIASFSQRYCYAFYTTSDLPKQEDSASLGTEYYSVIAQKSVALFGSPIVESVIKASYSGLFVDEYQDCTISQHRVIMKISEYLPTRIVGDPLQGIFEFQEKLVCFEKDLSNFIRFSDLSIPHRWYKKGNNSKLGELIKSFRGPLLRGEQINIEMNKEANFYVFPVSNGDIDNRESLYRKKLISLISNKMSNPDFENLLIIVPEYYDSTSGKIVKRGGVAERISILSKVDYSSSVVPLEAIDDKSFYSIAKDIDSCLSSLNSTRIPIKKIYTILSKLFTKTGAANTKNKGLNDWFKNNSVPNDFSIIKKKGDNIKYSIELEKVLARVIQVPEPRRFLALVNYVINELKLRPIRRRELVYSTRKCLQESSSTGNSIYKSMLEYKNIIRRVGRKVDGKCIGTTLLTKGLEFDTVVIVDAHKFECPKHLYVALTRCCKNLIIFTNNKHLPVKKALEIEF